MCDCDIDLTPIVEELKKHRPIIPAPGWRVFHVYLSADEPDYLRVSECHVFGWQMQDDDHYRLVIGNNYYTRVAENIDHVVLKPGEEFDKSFAFNKARHKLVNELVEGINQYWSKEKKKAFLTSYPDVKNREGLSKQTTETLIAMGEYDALDDDEWPGKENAAA
jgi:hypothetical protein